MEINGILNFYKPPNITSQSAVNVVKHIYGAKKAGHCGTLDPMAFGILPIMLGNSVKASEYLSDHNKRYIAKIALGIETDSEDTTGNVLASFEGILPDFDAVQMAVKSFKGEYMQTPPMYSALKVGGKKLVDLARNGISVTREPRKITIYSINALKKDDGIFLDVFCSKGTYIRTLCADIGKKLGCGACMDALERISVENFNVLSSHTLDELRNSNPEELAGFLIPTEKALDFFPPISLKHFFAELVRNGCAVETKKLELENIKTDCLYRLFDENLFFGVGAIEETDGIYTLKQNKFFG